MIPDKFHGETGLGIKSPFPTLFQRQDSAPCGNRSPRESHGGLGVLQWKMSCCNCVGGALIHRELESAPPVVTQSRSGTWRIWSDETSMAQLIESPVLFLLIPSPSTSQDPSKWVTSPLRWRATAVRGLCFPRTTFCNDPRSIACQLGWGKPSASICTTRCRWKLPQLLRRLNLAMPQGAVPVPKRHEWIWPLWFRHLCLRNKRLVIWSTVFSSFLCLS